jgi:hypothetical protein
MLMLATYTDAEGYAYPSQGTWAKAARKTPRTLQRYIARAKSEGWLSVGNAGRSDKGWRHNRYRCCVPDHVPLSEKDAQIADRIEGSNGSIDAGDTAMSQPTFACDTEMPSPSDPRAARDDMKPTLVTTSKGHGDDIQMSPRSRHPDVALSSLLTPASITHAPEAAPPRRRTVNKPPQETEEVRRKRREAAAIVEQLVEAKSTVPSFGR